MSGSSEGNGTGAYRGYRDTTQVDMPMAPPRPSGAVGARVMTPSHTRASGERPDAEPVPEIGRAHV